VHKRKIKLEIDNNSNRLQDNKIKEIYANFGFITNTKTHEKHIYGLI